MPAMQKGWPHFIFVSIRSHVLSVPKFFSCRCYGWHLETLISALVTEPGHLWLNLLRLAITRSNQWFLHVRTACTPEHYIHKAKLRLQKVSMFSFCLSKINEKYFNFLLQKIDISDWKSDRCDKGYAKNDPLQKKKSAHYLINIKDGQVKATFTSVEIYSYLHKMSTKYDCWRWCV